MVGRIRKLPDEVIRRIAAGEILLRPANAVKELIENALDAGANNIIVSVQDGGLRGLTVSDDGCGISRDDLALLCERHATSKLSRFEDLAHMQTFGFRGEALASISVAGRLTVVTKTQGEGCGWRASYANGHLEGEIEGIASNVGTIFTVDDLFHSFPERRKTFLAKSAEEHSRIFDVLCRYAISNAGKKGFTLRKLSKKMAPDLMINTSMDQLQVLTAIYGSEMSDNVCMLSDTTNLCIDKPVTVTLEMMHTNAYYRRKEQVIIIFINGRLVEWTALNKAVRAIFSQVILSGWHPFFFSNITLPTDRIDVNVSPTKHTVTISDADEIILWISQVLERSLKDGARVRKLPSLNAPLSSVRIELPTPNNAPSPPSKAAPYKRVYSDCRATKMEQFLSSPNFLVPAAGPLSPLPKKDSSEKENVVQVKLGVPCQEDMDGQNLYTILVNQGAPPHPKSNMVDIKETMEPSPWDLTSVRELRADIEATRSEEISRVIKKHIMVGCAFGGEKTFLQYESCLLVLSTRHFAHEYFYSLILNSIGRMKRTDLAQPMNLHNAIRSSIANGGVKLNDGSDIEKVIDEVVALILDKRQLFDCYFSMVIEDDSIVSVPFIIEEKAVPQIDLLGLLLFRLAVEVEWGSEEKKVIDGICREIAIVYAQLPFNEVDLNESYIKNRLFPALKKGCFGFPSSLARNGHIQVVTDLHSLYKQFDRC